MEIRHASFEINGAAVRERRKDAGMSVSELASRLGLSVAYVSHIERGHRPTVPPSTFHKICDALGVTDHRSLIRADAREVA